MIASLINKRLNHPYYPQIVWTPCEDPDFKGFIKRMCDATMIDLHSTYFGFNNISLIICNNRITHLDKSVALSRFLLCPLLVVDHHPAPSMLNNDHNNDFSIGPVYQIAISNRVYMSWNKIQDIVLGYNPQDHKNGEEWTDLVVQLSQTNSRITEKEELQYENARTT